MHEAYVRIFERCGLEFVPVEADTGSIGGSFSHEFMVLAESGEDAIAACRACGYGANVEKAEVAAREGAAEPPVVRTVTLADVYWAQGGRETANRIVEEILRKDPGNARALAWQTARREDPLEKTLREFLRATAKEYGHDIA